MAISILWLRNDLRLENHPGISALVQYGDPILALFIFDEEILDDLEKDDQRVTFFYDQLKKISLQLKKLGSSILIRKGKVLKVWENLIHEHEIARVYMAEDMEPYAQNRDAQVQKLLKSNGIPYISEFDTVMLPPDRVLKEDGAPYLVFTPYSKKWLEKITEAPKPVEYPIESVEFLAIDLDLPSLEKLGFVRSKKPMPSVNLSAPFLESYANSRNTPSIATSSLSPYLRFGMVDVRSVYQCTASYPSFRNEIIWREFFKQILYHFPRVIDVPFKAKYADMPWYHDEDLMTLWMAGKTGYPLVDAGMRELAATGMMHNRVRMVSASFLVKHLLIDWRWGEAYFAETLLDYDLSANNGNWQWVVGCGCDAAPYFRIFNPETQLKKFDPELKYVQHWIPEYGTDAYPAPIVEHKWARERALKFYKENMKMVD